MRLVLVSIAIMVAAIVLVVLLLSAPARVSWRKVRTSFKGFTTSREFAVITIRNEGPVPVKLRENFRLEYLGVPPYQPIAGLPNLVRLVPTQTNLIIAPSAQADLRILLGGLAALALASIISTIWLVGAGAVWMVCSQTGAILARRNERKVTS